MVRETKALSTFTGPNHTIRTLRSFHT
jgi:hypothetical protein